MWILWCPFPWVDLCLWHVIYPRCWYSWDCQLETLARIVCIKYNDKSTFIVLLLKSWYMAINQANHCIIIISPNCSYVDGINSLIIPNIFQIFNLDSGKNWIFSTYSFILILSFWPGLRKQKHNFLVFI